ncbi:uncharacterized protein BYT42DRAFT_518823 [Radiomyces spectabilis]|uniref:uncharacterized protein n=1 Tax=Radiomyces spectabilis TaxID=64574 RepID=UPI0022206843|nr:uncharacterized protein BYT42DRAFT_518823 [Radiomyces spectabilis]KAI8372778.1 hypothetical protein BYT42DRAFT_518823 [Radiomyces spectabilis]
MALKFELEQWQNACNAFDSKDYDTAVKAFITMADNAKMHFNIGLIFATVNDHERALAAYSRAISMDPYFAVAYFQKGVSQFILNNMNEAMQDFDNAYQKLRGNQIINYQQLGLAFRLYACEVLFNRGICQLYLGKIDAGLTDLYHAQKAKMTEEHDVIDQAVRDRGKGYSVYSIPPGVLYRPPESRLRQLHGMDMFSMVDKLGINKANKHGMSPMKLNNSVLLSESRFNTSPSQQQQQQPSQPPQDHLHHSSSDQSVRGLARFAGPSSQAMSRIATDSGTYKSSGYTSRPATPPTLYTEAPIPVSSVSSPLYARQPQHTSVRSQYSPTNERRRKDSNVTMYTTATDEWADSSQPSTASTASFSSSFRYKSDGRRVDSGFESAHEERYSSSSSTGRNSTRSHKTRGYSPPPVPPIPRSQSAYDDFDTLSYGHFDQALDEVYGSLESMTVQDRERERIRGRLNSNNLQQPVTDRRGSEQSGNSANSFRPFTPQPSTSASTTASGKEGVMAGRLKIKVHHTDTRILLVPSTITFDDLLLRIREKFKAPPTMRLQYKDEDDEMVLMIDDEDLNMARQINRLRNGMEKMEIWCVT